MRITLVRAARVLAAIAALSSAARAQDWTRFRGPNGTGVSTSKTIPVSWTEKEFRWRVEIPGESHSQPVTWGDKIFLTSATKDLGKERMLLCLRKEDGGEVWTKKYTLPTHKPGNNNSGFSNTSPAVDRDRVVACFVSKEHFFVKAFDHSGKELWSKDLGPFESQHGYGASPIFYEDKVIVVNDQDGESFVVALDEKTGEKVWQCSRRPGPQGTAYATPCLLRRDGERPELLLNSKSHGVSSIDPQTGSLNWEAVVFNLRAVASPIVVGDLVFGSCGVGGGKGNFLAAVRLGGKGDVTSTNLVYTVREASPYVPTPLALGERLYLISDTGFASCLEAATGRVIWKERVGGNFFGSPVLIDGKIYCPSAGGEMVVLATGDQFKVLARNPLGEGTHSSPCVDSDRLYQKTFTHLVCVGGK